MADEPRRLLVTTGPPGRHLAVSELPDGSLVLDDLTEGRRLGDLVGDADPFLITIDGQPHLVLAGHVPGPGADRVEINSPGSTPRGAFAQTRLVKNEVWQSTPEPFRAGMAVTVTWRRGDTVLFECESGPLRADALEPLFGPDWTGYAPLDV